MVRGGDLEPGARVLILVYVQCLHTVSIGRTAINVLSEWNALHVCGRRFSGSAAAGRPLLT